MNSPSAASASETPAPEPRSASRVTLPARPPRSASHFGYYLVALAVVLGTVYWLRGHRHSQQDDLLILFAAVAVPIIAIDVFVLKVHLRGTTGLDWDRPFEIHFARVATKLIGLTFTVGLIA